MVERHTHDARSPISRGSLLVRELLSVDVMMSSLARTMCDSHSDTIVTLPNQTGAYAIASACRDALLAFLNESQHWGKAELAMWLMGPYAQVAAYGDSTRPGSGERVVPLLREIDARMVQRVITTARTEVFSVLERLADSEGAATFTLSMLSSGFVVRCEDQRTIKGWVPTTGARRLADRVLSLLAVDFMTRPEDYDRLAVCSRCRIVELDLLARARGVCERHAPRATPQRTLPYFPEGA
jgi:hypothetical protein